MASLQDASALHLLFEFCPGGELLRLLQQSGRGALDGTSPSQRNLHPTPSLSLSLTLSTANNLYPYPYPYRHSYPYP